ncbi:MAG TPA: DNA ligase D [Vicinamibacterales bacterium]|nr:DNA ligase D [Vicinamibacterales bacterium]
MRNGLPVAPMLASLAEPPLVQPGLAYEPKYDGIRAIVEIGHTAGTRRGEVTLYSRNGNDKTAQFPEIVRVLRAIGARVPHRLILDGEIVAVDAGGRPLGFQQIQGRIHLTAAADIARAAQAQPAALVLFDLLIDGAEDLRREPLVARRLRLQQRIKPRAAERAFVRLSDLVLDDGRALLSRARDEGWEGLIVKDTNSVYESGRRSPAWRKMKLLKQQEFVVGGWTEPRQSRQHFGSLLLGYYDDRGALRWAGAVGTGFVQKELDRLAALLGKRRASRSPFADSFKTAEKAHWVAPTLVVEVRFTEWTSDGLLRQPVYLGTRDDKDAADVRREQAPAPKPAKNGAHAGPAPRDPGRQAGTPAPGAPAPPRNVDAVIDRLQELEQARKDGDLSLPNGDVVRVTNLAKVFWHDLKITKGDLMRYYAGVSPFLLPVVADRPMVMKRFPNGVGKPAFYQQRHPEAPPPGVRRELLPDDIEPIDEEGPRDRLIGGSLTTLLYMTQLASISQDPWFSRVSDAAHQDYCAIDLDPGEGAGFDRVLDVARWVKDEMDRLGVPGWPKTSGSRGLHIYIPLPPRTTYESGQLLCHLIASVVATRHPKVATIERMVKRRPHGTVYVDYLQNILGKTLACAYSARASDYAGVSTPLEWKEVRKDLDPRDYTIRTAPARFRKMGDLWAALRTARAVNLTAVLDRASRSVR